MANDIEERAIKERERLKELLFSFAINESKMTILEPVIENVSWMKVKLDDTRSTIKTLDVCIPYDNGGGQRGMRENPLFKGYESLFKSYMNGMRQIMDALPKQEAENAVNADSPKTVLELVRSKRRKEA